MQFDDETQLRQLQIRVQEELSQARADLDRPPDSPTPESDLGDRLEQIEQELTRLQRSHGLLFRGRRTRAVLGLLLSERLVLDDLGFDCYADYVSGNGRSRSPEPDDEATDAGFELASAQARLTDIENGVLDLDWLANALPELSLVEPPGTAAALSTGRTHDPAEPGAPLEAWHNPFAVEAGPSSPTPPLPRLDLDGPSRVDLPY